MDNERKTNSTNFMDFIIKISNYNYSITTSIFQKTKFEDMMVEEKFQQFHYPKNKFNRIICDIMMVIGFLSSFLFNISSNIFEATITSIVCSIISLIFIILSYIIKNIKYRKIFDYLSVLFFCFEGLSKGFIIWLRLSNIENSNKVDDIFSEYDLRQVFYHLVAFNLYVILKLEAYFLFTIVYSFMNLALIFISMQISNSTKANNFVIYEGLRNILWGFIFFSLRRFLDHLHRSIFSEKLRYESLYNYTFEFISGLNCNKIFMKNDEIVLIDNKIHDFLIEVNNYNQKGGFQEEANNNENEVGILFEKDANYYSKYLNYLTPYNNNFYYNKPKKGGIFDNEEENSINLKEASREDLNLKDYLNKLRNEEKEKSSKGIVLTLNSFKELGIYQLNYEDTPIRKYFEVYFRIVSKINDDFYYDLLFIDVSEVVLSKITICKENLIKQRFLAKIAHEFKTPIISIIGLITNMKQCLTSKFNDLDDGKSITYEIKDRETINKELNIIQNLSEYVIILVNDVIEYSKMGESLDIEPNMRQINIKEISNFSYEILKCLINCNSLKNERIKPILNFDERLLPKILISDEIRVKQVILNFISNSVKFTQFGKITLAFEIDEGNNSLLINVSDTGIGIKNEDKEKIFNDFIMLNDGKKANSQGSGLGLSICKNIAQKLPMKIYFESTYGQGCTFTISLPLYKEEPLNRSTSQIKEIDENSFSYSFGLYEKKSENNIDLNCIKPRFKCSNILDENKEEDEIKNQLMIQEKNLHKNDILNHVDKSIKNNICEDKWFNNSNPQQINNIGLEMITNPSKDISINKENVQINKILLVDDNSFINDSTKFMLSKILNDSKNKYEIIQLYDGVDIIRHVIDDQKNGCLIKCIITDENMEYMNGSEAVKFLRDLEKRSKIMNIKIISVSSYDDKSSTELMKKIGIDLTLKKPVSKITLFESLKGMNLL